MNSERSGVPAEISDVVEAAEGDERDRELPPDVVYPPAALGGYVEQCDTCEKLRINYCS